MNFREKFASSIAELKPFAEDGLLVDQGDKIIINENGRMFIRNIAMVFDAYLPAKQQQGSEARQRYSKTV